MIKDAFYNLFPTTSTPDSVYNGRKAEISKYHE